MTALNRKLIRDLRQLRTQAVAIALVIGCGVATFVMSLSAQRSLAVTQASYYDLYRFAQVFTHLKRAPNALARRIAEIPGVASVATRVVVDVTLDIPGMVEPAVGRLVSVPDLAEPELNRLHLRRGRYPEPGSRGEVLANEAFASAHGFKPGDRLQAVINGKLEPLTVVGIALSPEYVYQIRPGDLFPDDRRFGVLWMGRANLAAAFDLTDAFNDVTLTLMHGAAEVAVLHRLDALTAPYGGQVAYGRADQVSNRYVSDELVQLSTMAYIPPTIFLAVAAFILNVVLNRVVATQREQIAALKAFGYTRLEIGWHYLQFALLIVLAGALLGTAVGAWMGRDITRMYARFFRFPVMQYRFAPDVAVTAVAWSLAAGILGVMTAVVRAVRLPPAEAMRPEAQGEYHPTLIERLGLRRLFTQTWRMILRQVERRPVRAGFTVLGVALAVAVMILGSFSKDLIDYITEFQFFTAQRQDFTVGFVEPAGARALQDLAHLPGVLRLEPFRAVPVRLRAGHRERQVAIVGLRPEREIFRVLDDKERPVALPPGGLVLSEKLADLLGVGPGGTVTVEVLEGQRPVRELSVAATLRDYVGKSAYMDLASLNRFLREDETVSGAFLSVDEAQTGALYTRLKATPRVASVASQRAALRSFSQTMSDNLLRMRLFNVTFAGIIAFGVVYNAARIMLSERNRDLATLRVIGFTRAEISAILLGEVGLLTAVAIPLGLLLGFGLAKVVVAALETESQRFPAVVAPATYAFAVTVVVVAALLSGLVVRRRIDGLDLVAVLKSRD
jgi:putative ABC transport system permease protein